MEAEALGMFRARGGFAFVMVVAHGGCIDATVSTTGSARTGSEQLLLTGTSDQAIDCLDFRPLCGARVYLDTKNLSATDSGWISFSLRRAMARQGLLLVDEKEHPQVIVEAAVAAYGTDQADCSVSLPSSTPTSSTLLPLSPSGSSGSGALTRKFRQYAVVKLALLGIDAQTHRLVWETGTILHTGALDRRFCADEEVSRFTTIPELHGYPRNGN
jgi:hypothetical protein